MLSEADRELLDSCRNGVLGTVAKDGRPHLVPVCYARLGDEVVIAIDEKPKQDRKLARVRNIERDGRATLLVDRYSDDWTQLAWVRVDAAATVEPRGASHPDALAELRARYPQYREMALEELPLIRLRPERVVSWRWSDAA
ncbi:MAG: TIGR03668 family PPOX class F420-dependent oxidoreductase [Dehalococcoidia bacterium]|nr:TIGR03668 family PPOX class F420-dependent oxidoreductase [Dehalococcoidia bacterium]